jgi:hypothetical protein
MFVCGHLRHLRPWVQYCEGRKAHKWICARMSTCVLSLSMPRPPIRHQSPRHPHPRENLSMLFHGVIRFSAAQSSSLDSVLLRCNLRSAFMGPVRRNVVGLVIYSAGLWARVPRARRLAHVAPLAASQDPTRFSGAAAASTCGKGSCSGACGCIDRHAAADHDFP